MREALSMTTHYINITLLPDPEFSHAHLLGALAAVALGWWLGRLVFGG